MITPAGAGLRWCSSQAPRTKKKQDQRKAEKKGGTERRGKEYRLAL